MSEMNHSVSSLRRKIFTKDWPLDEDIRATASTVASHSFLANASGQYGYVYLTRYVKLFSENHFDSAFSQLSILDWGCGKGHVSKLLRDLHPKHVESCDLLTGGNDSTFGQDVPIIERFNIDVKPLQDERRLPYTSASFDVVLSVGVLEHVSDELTSIAEIARVLRPGGLFFCFFLPTRFSWTQRISRWGGENYHDRLYTEGRVREILNFGGLKLLDLWYRQLLPKNSFRYPQFRLFEKLDLFVTERTALRYFATNIEFVSCKQ